MEEGRYFSGNCCNSICPAGKSSIFLIVNENPASLVLIDIWNVFLRFKTFFTIKAEIVEVSAIEQELLRCQP